MILRIFYWQMTFLSQNTLHEFATQVESCGTSMEAQVHTADILALHLCAAMLRALHLGPVYGTPKARIPTHEILESSMQPCDKICRRGSPLRASPISHRTYLIRYALYMIKAMYCTCLHTLKIIWNCALTGAALGCQKKEYRMRQ